MRRALFCVDSYFQLIVSVSLRLEKYKNWDADIVIYNTTPSAGKIYSLLSKDSLFCNAYFADTVLARVGDNYSVIQKFPKYFVYLYSIIRTEKECEKILGKRLAETYEHFIFHGHGAIVECLFNTCYRRNKDIRCFRIDDGLGTYLREWGAEKWRIRIKLERFLYSIFKYEHIEKYIDGYYVSEPEMMAFKPHYPVIRLPKLDRTNKEYVLLLNNLFGYNSEDLFERKKVIFFGTWGYGVAEDIELINIIKEVVPKEQILIKIHPREDRKKYDGLGIDIMEKSEVPWEVVMMNHGFSESIFITAESSAVFTSRIYFRTDGIDIYAYKCLGDRYNFLPKTMDKWISLYKRKYKKDCIFVPDSKSAIVRFLKDIL